MKALVLLCIFLAAGSVAVLVSQEGAPGGGAAPGGGPANGPWNNDVDVYRIDAAGKAERIAVFERAGVPTLARLGDGRLAAAFQHFPSDDERNFDRVAVSVSSDEGRVWSEPEPIVVDGLEEGLARPFDPTLVPLPDGRVRLYFTSNESPDFRRSLQRIHSAVSRDGVRYTYEPGVRFGIEDRVVIDCAAVLHRGVFHLFVPDNGDAESFHGARGTRPPPAGRAYHATSEDGLSFTRVEDVALEGDLRWLGNAQSDGERIVFFGTGRGLFLAESDDGASWRPAGRLEIPGADPGAVKAKDGGWIVAATSPPRRTDPAKERVPPPARPDQAFAPGPPRDRRRAEELRVERIASEYPVAAAAPEGRFRTGQDADLMLGGFGFDRSGGALSLNHPSGLATDGKRLLVADRWNNRVLVWSAIPSGNTPPDLVLGQPDFESNDSASGREGMNWPGNVSLGSDGRLAVADTNNDRVLLWNAFPGRSGQPADLVLNLATFAAPGGRMRPGWPWGVWTDGSKLAVVATHGASVLVWNAWPQRDDAPPDFVLAPEDAGTPRNITSDGTFLIVGDHNHRRSRRPGANPANGGGGGMPGGPATMVWNTWPRRSDAEPDFVWFEWMKGAPIDGGGLVMGGIQHVFLWNRRPLDPGPDPDVVLQPEGYSNGDGPDAVLAGGKLFVCNYNGSNILAWNEAPRRDYAPPDFSLGSDRPGDDVWGGRFQIQNPVVATDGRSLFASSDFDRKLFVWTRLPDESGAKPDFVYHLPDGPWDNALHGGTLALGGRDSLTIWKEAPRDGRLPDLTLRRRIGRVELREITGVALDAEHLYVADRQAGKIYVWPRLPGPETDPLHEISVPDPGRLSSDGAWLAVAPFEGREIRFFRIDGLASGAEEFRLGGRELLNLPGKAIVAEGRLFVANTSYHRVEVWHDCSAAAAGRPPDASLGAADAADRRPGIGRAEVFMPGSLAWDGSRLWVGEFKFSTRILRYSPAAAAEGDGEVRKTD